MEKTAIEYIQEQIARSKKIGDKRLSLSMDIGIDEAKEIKKFTDIQHIFFNNIRNISKDAMREIISIPTLTSLCFSYTFLDVEHCEIISQHEHIRKIKFARYSIKNDGFAKIMQMPGLYSLDIAENHIHGILATVLRSGFSHNKNFCFLRYRPHKEELMVFGENKKYITAALRKIRDGSAITKEEIEPRINGIVAKFWAETYPHGYFEDETRKKNVIDFVNKVAQITDIPEEDLYIKVQHHHLYAKLEKNLRREKLVSMPASEISLPENREFLEKIVADFGLAQSFSGLSYEQQNAMLTVYSEEVAKDNNIFEHVRELMNKNHEMQVSPKITPILAKMYGIGAKQNGGE